MAFKNESSYYPSSPSLPSSTSNLSPCTLPYSSSTSNTSHSKTHSHSQKRKAGRKKFKETRHPVYRGVRQRNKDKWVCEVREPNKKSRIWLGTYPTPEMAARAYDAATLALRGTSSIFNFPDSVSLLPVAKSSSAKDIREAASKAAKAFRPNTNPSSTANNNFCVETNPCVEGDGIVNNNNTCTTTQEKIGNHDESNKAMFFDEEALYNMPGLLDSMAEGLIITPLSMKRGLNWDDVDCETELTLWTD